VVTGNGSTGKNVIYLCAKARCFKTPEPKSFFAWKNKPKGGQKTGMVTIFRSRNRINIIGISLLITKNGSGCGAENTSTNGCLYKGDLDCLLNA